MTTTSNPTYIASGFFYASAILHAFPIILEGYTLLAQIGFAIPLWIVVAYILRNYSWRWFAYLAFLGALIGIVVSMGFALDFYGLTRALFFNITMADTGAAVALFLALWSPRHRYE